MINLHLSKERDLTSKFINPNWHQSKIKGNKNPLIKNSTYNISFTNQNGREDIQIQFSSVQFSCSVLSDSLRPHEPQHAWPPCPSPTPEVHPNPCPLSRWFHPTILSSPVVLIQGKTRPYLSCSPLLLLSIFPSTRVFSNESALRIRWPKYLSFIFNISPSNEHPGLISFIMDCLDLLAV